MIRDDAVLGLFSAKALLPMAASILLLAVSGLTASDAAVTWLLPMILGTGLWIMAAVVCGLSRPTTAWATLAGMNLSFWLGWLLWRSRGWVLPDSESVGIDPYAGPLALWILILLGVGVYAVAVFGSSLFTAGSRKALSAVGLAAVAVQTATTLSYAWDLIQGV